MMKALLHCMVSKVSLKDYADPLSLLPGSLWQYRRSWLWQECSLKTLQPFFMKMLPKYCEVCNKQQFGDKHVQGRNHYTSKGSAT